MLGLNDIMVRVTSTFEDEDDVSTEETIEGDNIEFNPFEKIDNAEDHPSGLTFDDLIEELEGEHGVGVDFDCYDGDSDRKIVEIEVSKHDFDDLSDLEECLESIATRVSEWISGVS